MEMMHAFALLLHACTHARTLARTHARVNHSACRFGQGMQNVFYWREELTFPGLYAAAGEPHRSLLV